MEIRAILDVNRNSHLAYHFGTKLYDIILILLSGLYYIFSIKYGTLKRLIASILVVTFVSSDIAWAYPDVKGGGRNLAVTGLQNAETLARLKAGLIV